MKKFLSHEELVIAVCEWIEYQSTITEWMSQMSEQIMAQKIKYRGESTWKEEEKNAYTLYAQLADVNDNVQWPSNCGAMTTAAAQRSWREVDEDEEYREKNNINRCWKRRREANRKNV